MGFDDFSEKDDVHYYDGEPHTFNNFWLGFLTSMLLPTLCLLLVMYMTDMFKLFNTIDKFLNFILHDETGQMSTLFIMALMPSLFGFFYVYKTERWKMGQGYITGTMLFFALFFLRTIL